MLETYFSAPKMLAHLRNGPSGSFIDGFAQSLERSGYRPAIAVRYLRAAAHLGHFACEQGGTLADINLAAFHEHLRTCRCPRAKGGRRNHHTTFGAKNFLNFLQQIGVHRTNATPAIQSPSQRSLSASNTGCASIAVPPNRRSDSTLVGPPA
jgi:hypothetical protein